MHYKKYVESQRAPTEWSYFILFLPNIEVLIKLDSFAVVVRCDIVQLTVTIMLIMMMMMIVVRTRGRKMDPPIL